MSGTDAIDRLFVTGGGLLDAGAERPSRLGSRIGPYRLSEEIGRGGMATVYLGEREDDTFEQQVAIKILDVAPEGPVAAGFLEERRLLARLDHPSIARIYDGGTLDDGSPFLVMEFVRGIALDEHIKTLALDARLALFAEVCEAVAAAHREGIVHHDLKPQNVLVDRHGRPKLLDFGIARVLGAAGESDRRLLTPRCAAPEQFEGETAGPATDVFQLGLILYTMATDRRAADADTFEGLRRQSRFLPRSPASAIDGPFRRRIDADFDRIVAGCLAAEPSARYGHCRLLADDVAAWRDGRPTSHNLRSSGARVGHFVRRRGLLTVLGVTAIVALGVGLVMSWNAFEREQERARAMTELATDVLLDGGFEGNDRISENVAEIAGGAFAAEPTLERELARVAARRLIDDGAPRDAIDLLEQVITRAGRGFEVPAGVAPLHGLLGEAHGQAGRPDAAVTHLTVAIESADTASEQRQLLGERLLANIELGNGTAALADLDASIAIAPAPARADLDATRAYLADVLDRGCEASRPTTPVGRVDTAIANACARGLLPARGMPAKS